MAVGDIFSGMGLSGFSLSGIVQKAYFFAGIFLIFLILGGIVVGFIYFRRKEKTGKGKKQIIWWQEAASGDLEQRESQSAEEVLIPGTRLRLFYDKSKDEWLPRFTREIKKDSYYSIRTPTGNVINFGMGGLSRDFKEADKKYDHTDMLWASENAREFIKKNYRDKTKKWWQVYQQAITTAIFILVMTFSFVIIIYFMRGMVQDLGGVASAAQKAAEMCSAPTTSGLVTA